MLLALTSFTKKVVLKKLSLLLIELKDQNPLILKEMQFYASFCING